MDTIKEFKHSTDTNKPYQRGIRAKIIKIRQNTKAQELSLADHTGAIKCVAYDNVCEAYHQGQVIMMRQYEKGASGIMMLNKHAFIRPCPSLKQAISDDIMSAAIQLEDPPVPPIVAISSITTDTQSSSVSVEGVITHVST